MTHKFSRFIFLGTFLLLAPFFAKAETETNDPSPQELNDYIAIPDDSYRWELVEKSEKNGQKNFLVKMVSQTWHSIKWEHYVYIVEPKKLRHSENAVLYIAGSSIGKTPKDGDRLLVEMLAESSGSTAALLLQVPNQPLLGDYYEDALIGETLLKALEDNDSTWPLLFPMAKSAIRAMDTIQAVTEKQLNRKIKNFVVTGASKRGWTTWLTAASQDPRVLAIAPIVINTLNMQKQMEYQVETWGTYSPSIGDYTSRNLVQDSGQEMPEFKQRLWKMIDPYSYRSRYTIPKLLIHGTNDPYWTVDAAKFYWDDLPGVKYQLNLPNAGHGLDAQQLKAMQTLAVFVRFACSGQDWPKFTWTRTENDKNFLVSVKTDIAPVKAVRLWNARSKTKDFREAKWSFKALPKKSEFEVEIAKTKSKSEPGHIAFYVELETQMDELPCSVTTEVWRE